MWEVAVIAAGLLGGAAAAKASSAVARALCFAGALLVAAGIFVVSGEAEMSIGFLAWDLAQVAVASAASYLLVSRLLAPRTQ